MSSIFKSAAGSFKKQQDKEEQEAKFQNELASLKASLTLLKAGNNTEPKIPKNKEENSISVQLLMFHYLGFLQIEQLTNKNKSVLLSVLFGTEGTENIRKFLSNVGGKNSPLMKKGNLTYIEGIFIKSGLKEPLKKVQADLLRLFPD